MSEEQATHPIRSSENFYGRRHGKSLRPRQLRLVEAHLSNLLVDLKQPFSSFEELFPARASLPIMLEIGFGGGEHLDAERLRCENINFIGVEPFVNGLVKMLGKFDDVQSDNLRLYNDDAAQLLDWLPEACLDRIDLLYPDPWPKQRHFKRRFVNDMNLGRFARVLKPGGIFRFASDIDTYQDWTLQHIMRRTDFSWTAETADDWRKPWPNWLRTRYEAKAVREGRTSAYFIFERG